MSRLTPHSHIAAKMLNLSLIILGAAPTPDFSPAPTPSLSSVINIANSLHSYIRSINYSHFAVEASSSSSSHSQRRLAIFNAESLQANAYVPCLSSPIGSFPRLCVSTGVATIRAFRSCPAACAALEKHGRDYTQSGYKSSRWTTTECSEWIMITLNVVSGIS